MSISPPSQSLLALRFPEPVVDVRIEVGGASGPATLRAYDETRLIGQTSEGDGLREVVGSAITRITIQLSFQRLQSIAYTTEVEECNASNWGNPVRTLRLPTTTQDALKLLENGLRNYYAGSLINAISRYEPHVGEMIDWLGRLQNPTDVDFHDPTQPLHLLQIRNDDGKGITSGAYPQSILLLAALDPNIARTLCLYWVDVLKPDGGGDPQKGTAYDYKVEGVWKDETLCGLLFNLGMVEATLPTLEGELKGEQLPGFRWNGRSPLARVGLSWPRPVPSPEQQVRAVQPVLYDLFRMFDRRNQLVLAPQSSLAHKDTALFIDRDLPLGGHSYSLRPIDLFGQVGKELRTQIKVEDLDAPPPPVRLRTMLYAPDVDPSELHLQFEYGALQHKQAPDVKQFNIYWRPDSLSTRLQVRVDEVRSETREGNRLVHTLHVDELRKLDDTALPLNDLQTSAGDVLTNVLSTAEVRLPANQRRRYRIKEFTEPDNVILEPTSNVLESGNYELIRDPHNRANWTKLTQTPVQWREPVSGVVQQVAPSVSVSVLDVRQPPPQPDPFKALRPNQTRPLPAPPPAQEPIEVRIDRDLLEPEVFTGVKPETLMGAQPEVFTAGTARIGMLTEQHRILYVISSGRGTRIGLPPEVAVSAGQTLTLTPAPDFGDRVRLLTISGRVDNERLKTPGGEVAFEEERGDEEVTHVARVISSAVNGASSFSLLARFTKKQVADLVRPNVTSVRYYAPYREPIAVSLGEESNAPIKLLIPADAGSRSAYVAISAMDEPGNEGPLSAPAQFTVFRPKPSGRPTRPYPCQLDANAEAGYASPPDRQGRATICLKWDVGGISPASGLRYEVARALDNGILAAHLRNWQLGKPEAEVQLPLVAGPSLEGNLSDVNFQSERGLYRATFTPSASLPDPEIFRKGRLSQNGAYFEVTLAKRTNDDLQLLVRSSGPNGPTVGDASIEAPPDYSAVQEDDAALQQLAEQNSEAFGMATGMPISETQFTDQVPGIGRNRFFYRVRAVDAAENRSAWSPVSVPFHQVDTTNPPAPVVFQVLGGDRKTTLRWYGDPDPRIIRYHVYRALTRGELESPFNLVPAVEFAASVPGSELEYTDQPLEGTVGDMRYYYCITAVKRVHWGPGDNDWIEIVSKASELSSAQVTDTIPPAPPDWLGAEWWDTASQGPATGASNALGVRLEWQTAIRGAICWVERSDPSVLLWQRVGGALTAGATDADAVTRFVVVDMSIVPTNAYSYRLRLRNNFQRENTEFRTISIEPLR